jgi:hypothetical protein
LSSNVYNFEKLAPDKKQELLTYIENNFSLSKTFNHRHSAYGLKQPFTRLFGDKDTHITSRCFMEAMLAAGFQAKPIPDVSEPNWRFNIKLRKPRN